MKKWFLAACLPLMIVSCDIFGLGDDGDDDDTMIVDPPMANVSFDYEDKILSGDTLPIIMPEVHRTRAPKYLLLSEVQARLISSR